VSLPNAFTPCDLVSSVDVAGDSAPDSLGCELAGGFGPAGVGLSKTISQKRIRAILSKGTVDPAELTRGKA
jgi:hypothetical protein